MLQVAAGALPPLYKARKWLLTRADIPYTAYWILFAANSVARMEVIAAGLLPDREVIPQAEKLNPALMRTIYSDLLRNGTDRKTVEAALNAIEEYLSSRAAKVFAPVLEYLREHGDV